ncbi:hypothetical protein K3495_g16062, partial [Podosphaera aphanis]
LGCKAYVQIPVERRVLSRKLDDRAEIGILLGYEGQHIFRVYIPSRRKVIRSSNVRFDENSSITIPPLNDEYWEASVETQPDLEFPIDESRRENQEASNQSQSQLNQQDTESFELGPFERLSFERHQTLENEGNEADSVEADSMEEVREVEESLELEEAEEIDEVSQAPRPRGRPPGSKNGPKKVIEPSTRVLRPNRVKNINDNTAFVAFVAAANSAEIDRNDDDPKTMIEALSGKYREQWKEGFRREYDSIGRNKTWVILPRSEIPPGTKVLSGKIVLRTKRDKNGDILKYKVRWVIRGFEQRFGRDFTQTYAGVCRNTSWKVALAIAAIFDLEIEQLDAVTAFLNS